MAGRRALLSETFGFRPSVPLFLSADGEGSKVRGLETHLILVRREKWRSQRVEGRTRMATGFLSGTRCAIPAGGTLAAARLATENRRRRDWASNRQLHLSSARRSF